MWGERAQRGLARREDNCSFAVLAVFRITRQRHQGTSNRLLHCHCHNNTLHLTCISVSVPCCAVLCWRCVLCVVSDCRPSWPRRTRATPWSPPCLQRRSQRQRGCSRTSEHPPHVPPYAMQQQWQTQLAPERACLLSWAVLHRQQMFVP